MAFLPRSQVDIRPIRDVTPLMNSPQPFQILKMDRRRGNIVVSRRTVLEETRAEQRQELVQNLEEGQVIDGVVKNITDYGAFVDLGGIDGLLHVTDIAWRRVNHPTEVLNIGQSVKVKIIKINHETHRISLGMKQLQDDPWQGIEAKYPVGAKFKGRVTNITDYGAFVELEPGIEGLIHVSEMSWTKKNVHPGKIVSTSQEVEVQVLEVDPVKRRISLGLKQTMRNPWEVFVEKYPPGSMVEGEVKNKTEFGLFLGLDGDVDGMVHLSDLDWKRPGEQVIEEYKKGDMVKAQVLDVDVEKERISLGIKQLAGDPMSQGVAGEMKKGDVVTCEVTEDQGKRPRSEDRRHRPDGLHQARRSRARPRRPAHRPLPGRPEGRRPRHPVRPQDPQGRRLDQGAGSGRREGGHRAVRLVRLPAPRSATSSAPRSSSATKRRPKRPSNSVMRRRRVFGRNNRACPVLNARGRLLITCLRSDSMSLDADPIVDRRRMRRKLTFWRVGAVVASRRLPPSRLCLAVSAERAAWTPAGGYIARIKITGLIREQPGRVEALERLAKSSAQAVIVHINSPGGTTAGSEQLYDALRRLQAKKPMVVVVDGLAASGGYIAAMAADHIVAQETSLVGSIGVLFQYPNVTELLKTVGVKVEAIKSSPLKAAPSGFEPTSPEARAAIEAIVMDSYAWFKGLVQDRRKLDDAPARQGGGRPGVHRPAGDRAQAGRRARQREDRDRLAANGEEHRRRPRRSATTRLTPRFGDLSFLHIAAFDARGGRALGALAQRIEDVGCGAARSSD